MVLPRARTILLIFLPTLTDLAVYHPLSQYSNYGLLLRSPHAHLGNYLATN